VRSLRENIKSLDRLWHRNHPKSSVQIKKTKKEKADREVSEVHEQDIERVFQKIVIKVD
jgi:hypothetical protein